MIHKVQMKSNHCLHIKMLLLWRKWLLPEFICWHLSPSGGVSVGLHLCVLWLLMDGFNVPNICFPSFPSRPVSLGSHGYRDVPLAPADEGLRPPVTGDRQPEPAVRHVLQTGAQRHIKGTDRRQRKRQKRDWWWGGRGGGRRCASNLCPGTIKLMDGEFGAEWDRNNGRSLTLVLKTS